ncbi:MAG: hypothetical protein HON90_16490 [Halobacteriovoraceae bacterium]|jgi:hypothetical protein|nr:hypothetical protein [Halobacteriovoraceae bacterium]
MFELLGQSGELSESILLVKKANLLKLLDLIPPESRLSALSELGINPPSVKSEKFNIWVKMVRTSLDLKGKELALRAGVIPGDISNIENCKKAVSYEKKMKVHAALVEELLVKTARAA